MNPISTLLDEAGERSGEQIPSQPQIKPVTFALACAHVTFANARIIHGDQCRYFEPAASLTPAVLVSLAIALAAIGAIFVLRSRRGGRAPAVSFGFLLLTLAVRPAGLLGR